MSLHAGSKLRKPDDLVLTRMGIAAALGRWEVTSRKEGFNLQGNWGRAPTTEHTKYVTYFLMDADDREHLKRLQCMCANKQEREQVTMDYMRCLTDCVKDTTHNKKFYMRWMPSAKICPSGAPRVFTDEILETLPLVLKKQGTYSSDLYDKLANYRRSWRTEEYLRKTIELKKFEQVLEEFDVNKDLITIIEDPSSVSTREGLRKHGGHVEGMSWDMKKVFDAPQACRVVLKELVKGFNWKKDQCKHHEYCMAHRKTWIMRLMRKIMDLEEGAYITDEFLTGNIMNVRKECGQTYLTDRTGLDYILPDEAESLYKSSHYIAITKVYQLPVYKDVLGEGDRTKEMKNWVMKCLLELGWIQNFFSGSTNLDIRDVLVNTLMFEVPYDKREKALKFFNSTLGIPFPKLPAGTFSVTPPTVIYNTEVGNETYAFCYTKFYRRVCKFLQKNPEVLARIQQVAANAD